jgi:hypothetical protein
MRIAEAGASVLLSDDGCAILSVAGIQVDSLCWLDVEVVESEDLGLWIRTERGGLQRVFLLRWEYILGIDLESGKGRLIGCGDSGKSGNRRRRSSLGSSFVG